MESRAGFFRGSNDLIWESLVADLLCTQLLFGWRCSKFSFEDHLSVDLFCVEFGVIRNMTDKQTNKQTKQNKQTNRQTNKQTIVLLKNTSDLKLALLKFAANGFFGVGQNVPRIFHDNLNSGTSCAEFRAELFFSEVHWRIPMGMIHPRNLT